MMSAVKLQNTHNVVFLGYEGIQLLDLVAPLESFKIANQASKGILYETFIISENSTFTSDSGIKVASDYLLSDQIKIDTLVIPGGAGSRVPEVTQPIKQWIDKNFDSIDRVITVCTGMFFVAHLPYLENKEVATHWKFIDLLQSQFPALRVNKEQLFIQQGKFFSSAGILSGVDLALNIIEQDHDLEVASFVAKYLVTYLKRSGHQSQFSEPLKFQAHNNGHLDRVNRFLNASHEKPVTIATLAEQVHVSERHLNRLITKHFNMSAAKYIEHTKLEQSKIYLAKKDTAVSLVGASVGYSSSDSFTRSFKRKYGITPQAYQLQYQ